MGALTILALIIILSYTFGYLFSRPIVMKHRLKIRELIRKERKVNREKRVIKEDNKNLKEGLKLWIKRYEKLNRKWENL